MIDKEEGFLSKNGWDDQDKNKDTFYQLFVGGYPVSWTGRRMLMMFDLTLSFLREYERRKGAKKAKKMNQKLKNSNHYSEAGKKGAEKRWAKKKI